MAARQLQRAQHSAPHSDDTFSWAYCQEHPQEHIALSVIRVAGCRDWCVGDGDQIRGHWVEANAA